MLNEFKGSCDVRVFGCRCVCLCVFVLWRVVCAGLFMGAYIDMDLYGNVRRISWNLDSIFWNRI